MVKETGYGIASFVLSLMGFLFGFFSILAIIFGAIQKKKGQTPLGKAGLIMGIIGLSLLGLLILIGIFWILISFLYI